MKLTDNEIEVLFAVKNSCYHDGDDPVNNQVWSSYECLDLATVSKNSLGGVLASLVKKELVNVQNWDKCDSTVAITEAGVAALKNLREEYLAELRKYDCRVVFCKKDGTRRDMVCTLRPEVINMIMEHKEASASETTRKQSEDVIVVYDLVKNDWRSFRVDSILSFQPIAN